MKKNIILGIIIALLVICVAVEGFIIWKQYNDKSNEEEQKQEIVDTPSPEPLTKPKELPKNETIDGENLKISKKYSNPDEDELVYTYLTVTVEDKLNYNPEYDEDYYKYVYNIPQINIDSENVDKINKEILKKYEDIIDEMNSKQYLNLGCEGLSYKYYENDGILSLLMASQTESGGVLFGCKTYNIDISKGKEINNEELLKKINITKTDLNDKILKTIDNLDMYKSDVVGEFREESFIKEQKNKTINRYKNISLDKLDLFLNDDNHICAYMEMSSIAGGDITTMILDLETSETIVLIEV